MTNEEFIKSISLDDEIWKDVVGYEGLYLVSNKGRIISLSRDIANRYSVRHIEPKLLNPYARKVSKNYLFYCVSLWKNNKSKCGRVHRLVAKAFIPNPNNLPEIDHIDTDTSNNKVENLRWCTRLQNANNPITKENNRIIRLGKPMPKLRKKIVQIQEGIVVNSFSCIKDVAKMGFNKCSVSSCCNKKRKTHKGYQWLFLSDYEKSINKSKNA